MNVQENLLTKLAAALLALGLGLFWLQSVRLPEEHMLAFLRGEAPLIGKIALALTAILAVAGLLKDKAAGLVLRESYNLLVLLSALVCLGLPWLAGLELGGLVQAVLPVVALLVFLIVLSQRFFAPFLALGAAYVLTLYVVPSVVRAISPGYPLLACLPSLLALLAMVSALVAAFAGGPAAPAEA